MLPGTPCLYFWTLNYKGQSDVTGPPLCSSKGDATEGAVRRGAKTLLYWEVVPPGTLRVYFWTLKLKSEAKEDEIWMERWNILCKGVLIP